jgi:hypothetical protein
MRLTFRVFFVANHDSAPQQHRVAWEIASSGAIVMHHGTQQGPHRGESDEWSELNEGRNTTPARREIKRAARAKADGNMKWMKSVNGGNTHQKSGGANLF